MSTRDWRILAPLLIAAVALATGALLHLGGAGRAATPPAVGVAVVLVPLAVGVARSLLRGDVGVDLIALIAMAGALALGEYLAAPSSALMLSGGNALEAVGEPPRAPRADGPAGAGARPTRAGAAAGGRLEVVPVDALRVGDVVRRAAGRGRAGRRHAHVRRARCSTSPR